MSLTPDLGKILEGFIAKTILGDIRPNIDDRQYGNLKGSSSAHYLIFLLDEVLKGLEEKDTMASLILVDFKKAFDYVDHTTAVGDLISMGCRSSIVPFIIDFLSGREHRVRYGDATSTFVPITCGVPQGTVIGPVVLCLVNSVCQAIARRAKFVDDLTLAHIIKLLHQALHFPQQQDLDALARECIKKLMETNPVKCEVMHAHFAQPIKRQPWPLVLPDLTLNGEPLPVVDECKLLGIYINDRLDWTTHIQHLLTKASKCLFTIIQAKKFQFKLDSILKIYE